MNTALTRLPGVLAEAGRGRARALVSYFVGQGVGLVESVPTCRQAVEWFIAGFADALEEMQRLAQED
jgi:hypothetical protein